MALNGHGHYCLKGRSQFELTQHFPDENSATEWIESCWAVLNRAYHGTNHHLSKKHLNRYVTQSAGKHNLHDYDTIDQMAMVVRGMVGNRLRYKDVVA